MKYTNSLDPKLGSDIWGLVSRICMAEREDLLAAKKDLMDLIDTGYYDGDGDHFMNAALMFIESKLK